jgi:hypothetical protein
MSPMIIYLDNEYTALKSNLNDIKLISIGLVDETGTKTFYAELTEGYTQSDCCQYVIEEVLPLLDASELSMELDYSVIYARMTFEQIREYLSAWFKQFDGPIVLRSESPEFQLHFFNRIFNEHSWPQNLLPGITHCLPMASPMQLLIYNRRAENIYDDQKFRRDHALDDAKVMRLAMIG